MRPEGFGGICKMKIIIIYLLEICIESRNVVRA